MFPIRCLWHVPSLTTVLAHSQSASLSAITSRQVKAFLAEYYVVHPLDEYSQFLIFSFSSHRASLWKAWTSSPLVSCSLATIVQWPQWLSLLPVFWSIPCPFCCRSAYMVLGYVEGIKIHLSLSPSPYTQPWQCHLLLLWNMPLWGLPLTSARSPSILLSNTPAVLETSLIFMTVSWLLVSDEPDFWLIWKSDTCWNWTSNLLTLHVMLYPLS